MAQGTYEAECERAELLGVDPPNRDIWEESERVRKENELAEQLTEINIQDEQINEGTSKMDDITNILSITQMRLNKFKKACGSLTNLLKIRGPGDDDTADLNQSTNDSNPNEGSDSELDAAASGPSGSGGGSTDMQQKMAGQLGRLDSLLTKTENAQYSMQQQNKQMKSFLQ